MFLIEDYILLPKEERQTHINLDDPCIDRGGHANGSSFYCKGLLAHVLDTTIPFGHKIHLCHLCYNSVCANPNHMYWGTAQENRLDQIERGTSKTIFQRTVDKYGYEEACRLNSRGRSGNTNGSGNKGKPKSEEHKRKLSENHRGGRKKKIAEVM